MLGTKRCMAVCTVLAMLAVGCGAGPYGLDKKKKICVVLSVGAADGLAHIGAIKSLREKDVPIDCVVGTSMGALVGGLYAFAPERSTEDLLVKITDRYVQKTKEEAEDNSLLGALFGLIFSPVGAIVGALAGGAGVDKRSHERFVGVIREEVGETQLEDLRVPFATSYVELTDQGVQMTSVTRGPLADAIGGSIANALIFEDLDVKPGVPIDPGVDRLAVVPVDLACETFPGSQLIAVNVSGRPTLATKKNRCPISEITIPPLKANLEVVLTDKAERDRVVEAGYAATTAKLKKGLFE